MRKRLVVWGLAVAAGIVVTLAVIVVATFRGSSVKARLTALLADRLKSDVTLDDLDVSLFPRVRLFGSGLVIRIRGRSELPPLITIEHFDVSPGWRAAFTRHVGTVHLDGLRINIPPSDSSARQRATQMAHGMPHGGTLADHLISHDALLVFVGAHAGRQPLTFPIQNLEIDAINFDRPMPFHARLTNPTPEGAVDAAGTFGPWVAANPADTHVDGGYTLSDANLGTINGIGGTLTSQGTFAGQLADLHVTGTTHSPNFSLDLGGAPVPLDTAFQAVVNGGDGSTVLTRVDATLGHTAIQVTGAILNLPGPGRHDVKLNAQVSHGRIEDLLRLALTGPEPLLTGSIDLHAAIALPPGPSRVSQRLTLDGRFGVGGARFAGDVQDKLQTFSQRSQGKPDAPPAAVTSDFNGTFSLGGGVLRIPQVAFQMPGASVTLSGAYHIDDGALDFLGTLRMQATVSHAVGGVKSIFLRLVDPLFKKGGAGAVVPIKITGTRDAPRVGLDIGRVLKRGK